MTSSKAAPGREEGGGRCLPRAIIGRPLAQSQSTPGSPYRIRLAHLKETR